MSRYRVLVVDDHAHARAAMCEILSMDDSFEVIGVVESGAEAIAFTAQWMPDLILIDIQMPEMNGLEAASSIRALKHPDAERIPIIAMTANTFKEDVESALNAGMTGFVSKPIDVAYLYQELNSVLANSKRD